MAMKLYILIPRTFAESMWGCSTIKSSFFRRFQNLPFKADQSQNPTPQYYSRLIGRLRVLGKRGVATTCQSLALTKRGKKRSEASLLAVARLQQYIIDSMQRLEPKRTLLSMGDYNDNPNYKSIRYLMKENSYNSYFQPLNNPMQKLFKKGVGSLAYRDKWFLFDQILVDQELLTKKGVSLLKTAVFNPPYLRNQNGKYKGILFGMKFKVVNSRAFPIIFPYMLF